MEKDVLKQMNVGDIVAKDFSTARVLKKYGIDFCCHGDNSLVDACDKQNISLDKVIADLQNSDVKTGINIPFESWPLDLLIDYVLKIHHRGIRKNGPVLKELLEKVRGVHGANHPELFEIYDLVSESLVDLDAHLTKEEEVLFPYLYDLFKSYDSNMFIEPMHCGTIANPIRVMRMEHEAEGERYLHIREITNNFTAPEDGCATYRLMMSELENFVDALFEHIHIENNIIFPGFEKVESECVR